MIFLRPTTREDVDLRWLRSEWSRFNLPSAHRPLVDRPDLNDPNQNEARSRILRFYRSFIVDQVPRDARYRYVRVEERDLPSLYILTCWDWFLDTGRTFELTNTLMHLAHGRGGVINGVRQTIDHLRGVEEKIPSVHDFNADASDEYLILVATDERGPYTIIDGTHRAAALLREHQRLSNMPWNGILIDSPSMTANRWHIGYTGAAQILSGLGALADRRHIW